jgi:hypothetical protein
LRLRRVIVASPRGATGALWKWYSRNPAGDEGCNDLQAAEQVRDGIGLSKAGVANHGAEHNKRRIAGCIEDSDPFQIKPFARDLGAQVLTGEPHVDDREVGR